MNNKSNPITKTLITFFCLIEIFLNTAFSGCADAMSTDSVAECIDNKPATPKKNKQHLGKNQNEKLESSSTKGKAHLDRKQNKVQEIENDANPCPPFCDKE